MVPGRSPKLERIPEAKFQFTEFDATAKKLSMAGARILFSFIVLWAYLLVFFIGIPSAGAQGFFIYCKSGPVLSEAIRMLNEDLNSPNAVLAAEGRNGEVVGIQVGQIASVSNLVLIEDAEKEGFLDEVAACVIISSKE